jgi:hypothetical protein
VTSYWVLQANPKLYDIDGSLRQLTDIVWRTPQYTGSIEPGDGAVLWRSGTDAGIVGIGRITGYPAQRTTPESERPFIIGLEDDTPTTQVPVSTRPCSFVAKDRLAELAGWKDHQILTAPMGTVFPITQGQWSALAPLLPDLPVYEPSSASALPPAWAWEQRRKDVYPLPGGYTGYLDTLRRIVDEAATTQPTKDGLQSWNESTFGVTETSARLSLGFLLRVGILHESGGVVSPSLVATRWLEDRDHASLIALLHGRTRFIGEFLAEIAEPTSDSAILEIANTFYGAGWQTKAQIHRRRGWLESAGMLTETDSRLLVATDAGRQLTDRLKLHARTPHTEPAPKPEKAAPAATGTPNVRPTGISELSERLIAAANDGTDPDRFEKETAEVFRQLGFNAKWTGGGAGKTDVLLEAELGRDHSYRVVIDCKSTSRGSVSQQIDWDTIDEHRSLHHADHAAIVAPSFGGGRLPDRAERHGAVLLTASDLAELLSQHHRIPLGLDNYRLLFQSRTTEEGLAAISEAAEAIERQLELADTVMNLLVIHGPRFGLLRARDLALLLGTQDDLPDATEEEIAAVLEQLSSPLVGALRRDTNGGVHLAGSPATAAAMLRVVATHLDTAREQDADTDA